MEYVTIGKILNTFGIKGELKVDVYTDFPEDRFQKGSTVYVGDDYLPFKVASHREHKGFMLLLLENNEDINLVEKFKGMYLYKSKDDIKPLQDGQYYFSDLKDLDVYADDEKIGKVLNVESGLRNNNLRVLKAEDNKEYLIPFIPVFIKKVDLEERRIDINRIEGLI
ncbi:MAG: ribosome maturation factor RimM [Erysipelotrichaceae bacterium]|nr:ribosome maturation factor RimM [Erysipelotrichaceae bacterium]